MLAPSFVAPDPWRVEIIVVRSGSHSSGDRRSLHRDVERGLLIRLRKGAYVERAVFERLGPEAQHVVRMRGLAAVSDAPPVFSHWSAAVLHGLPVLRSRLARVHTTVAAPGLRSEQGVCGHVFAVHDTQLVRVRDLVVTGPARTVVDVAGGGPLDEGVMAADGALHRELPRESLEAAADLAGPRRAERRIAETIAFAHPGAETAIESRGRVTMLRIGVEVPELQVPVRLTTRTVFLDYGFDLRTVGVEADGDVKYLDPVMAPDGPAAALRAEKRREDELRSRLRGFARFGWTQSGSPELLRPVLARAGVVAVHPRPTIADFAAAARSAVPRRRSSIVWS